jgi:hypothetical protein
MPMNPDQGPIELLVSLFAEPFHPKYKKPPRMPEPPLTPAQKTLRRALCGAFFVTACLWLEPVMSGIYLPALWQSHNPPIEVWLPFAVWAFAALAGFVALQVGLKEAPSRVPQTSMGAFWAVCVMAGIGVLYLKQIFPPHASAAYFVRGLYVSGFAVMAVYFWIASGLAAGNAERRARREADRRNAPLRPARPSRFPFR